MTKQRFIDEMSRRTGMKKRHVEAFIVTMTDLITEKITKHEKVAITGFGTFDMGKRASRRGRNPQNGEYIIIPEMPMPRFRAGKKLKEASRELVVLSK